MDTTGIVLIVIGVLVLALVGWLVGTYNRFVRLRNLVQESWRQIDVELHRRHDLIPNLVETVKGYAAHEQSVFDAVTRARAAAAGVGASPEARAEQEGALSQALGRLFAVAEAYPQLQANQNFLSLQAELTNTEDRIAAGRRFYNANVRSLNTSVESFPASIVAGLFHFTRAGYFEANDPAVRLAPQVAFGSPGVSFGGAPGGPPATPPMPAGPLPPPPSQAGGAEATWPAAPPQG
jgi:LemA protein